MTTHPAYPAAKEAATKRGLTVFDYLNEQLEARRKEAKSPTLSHLTSYFFCECSNSWSKCSVSGLCGKSFSACRRTAQRHNPWLDARSGSRITSLPLLRHDGGNWPSN